VASPVWAFDVDGCLVDSLTGASVRPGAVELLGHLRDHRYTTVLWSAGGAEYAEQRAGALGLDGLFDRFHGKDERGPDGRYLAHHVAPAAVAVVFVDDRPEDLPLGADVVGVSPYLSPNPHDRGLAVVARRAGLEAN
jgi:phosphoglycolate phosphatase-like HAD superfamily hydrolase